MQKVRLHTLTGPVEPADNLQVSSYHAWQSSLPPASPPMFAATCVPCTSDPRIPSLAVNSNTVYDMSSPAPSILIIDDSPTIRKVVETILRREGYGTLTFPDGVAALQWLTEIPCPPPKMVLLDIQMPKMDGYAIAHVLKAKPALMNMMIIMMSRRDGLVDRLKGRLVGAKDYLIKPFTTEDLIRTVRQYYLGNEKDKGK